MSKIVDEYGNAYKNKSGGDLYARFAIYVDTDGNAVGVEDLLTPQRMVENLQQANAQRYPYEKPPEISFFLTMMAEGKVVPVTAGCYRFNGIWYPC